MPTIVYSEPHQVRTNCGPDPYVAKHPGRGLPRYMTGVMDDLIFNGSGAPPPNPARFVVRSTTVATTTTMIINWTLPLSGGTTRTGFKLFITTTNVAPAPSGSGTTVGASVVTNTFTGLTNGLTYYAWVYAQSSSGYSSVATSGALLLDALPGEPTDLGVNSVTSSGFVITWNNPGVGGDTLYFITTLSLTNSAPNPFTDPLAQTIALGVGTASFTGLSANTLYYIWVWAINLSGNSTPLTSSNSTNPAVNPPGPPMNVAVSNPTTTSLQVDWVTDPDAQFTFVWWNTVNTPPMPGITPPQYPAPAGVNMVTATPLTSGQTYYFFLASQKIVGITDYYSSLAGPVSGTTL